MEFAQAPMLKVMVVFGTRPEAIKLAPVIRQLQESPGFSVVTVSTGQHKEMLDQVSKRFGLRIDYNLNLMVRGQNLNQIIAKAIDGLDPIIDEESPDALVVQGDTTTAVGAALAGFNQHVQVVHVEAGLRSDNLWSPFPEEANRKIVSQVTGLHLAPTQTAVDNLLRENVEPATIKLVGNTVIDALHLAKTWDTKLSNQVLDEFLRSYDRVVLGTTHRRENVFAAAQIGEAFRQLAEQFPDTGFVLPLHLNPVIRENLIPKTEGQPNILVCDPMPYDEFISLMNRSYFVVTDSGGIQEEAPALGKPVLVMRANTERHEAVSAGNAKLIGTARDGIVSETALLLEDENQYREMSESLNAFGDGRAAERVVAALTEYFDLENQNEGRN
ncbi:UDP-N-acetylglucosamine 2-epimerase (non-hydrolyzing) [Corynebacterium sp. Marseille-P3884]|uniref:non-hydrolyzing UDP-N-acetylglucosamine 2-epimerase n=1 Tax=Corynebacterium sp. Marseille-P3884 TaxID=2495409 RepID=UPI001FF0AEE6|nr:UDP-N-acetylglucosamine 2-epimerase (non-hydrolyzing) [Corynebacterium sp. Marseille-P3884]